jgi:hypothetical protein
MQVTDETALATLQAAVAAHRALDLALHIGSPFRQHAEDRDTAMLALARAGRRVSLYTVDAFHSAAGVRIAPAVRS